MWTPIPAGLVLLLIGQLGARSGLITLPFYPHHLLTQLLGFGLLLWGLTRWK